ncbi:MAG: hypothetical protein M1819_005305 [Sarea resinae]|nr:MAG: hypothetical protein M1819_005305 [Sarea resinae]
MSEHSSISATNGSLRRRSSSGTVGTVGTGHDGHRGSVDDLSGSESVNDNSNNNNNNNNTTTNNNDDNNDPGRPVADQDLPRKKQKRNKPTLNCRECVNRKTKGRESMRARDRETAFPFLLASMPSAQKNASNPLGIGSRHPFSNYWTCQGGLAEVVSVLPSKDQSDILLSKYFDSVDPVYPMIHKETFRADYEHFWASPPSEREKADPALVALMFAILAMGTQFIKLPSKKERAQTAEFYASASNQALIMFSYLNKASIRSIQALLLVIYFLMNDNHALDAYSVAGIVVRQAYALGLHRDPHIISPSITAEEITQRLKLWQAVHYQDTFLTVLLNLPPSTTHTDVRVEDLGVDDDDDSSDIMFIKVAWRLADLVQSTLCTARSLGLPISHSARHKAKLVAEFGSLYASFPAQFRDWDDESLCARAVHDKRSVLQTLFLTSNYFHSLMLLHQDDGPEHQHQVDGSPLSSIIDQLDAAHHAINSYFLMYRLFESESTIWWVFQHRAVMETLTVARLLKVASQMPLQNRTPQSPSEDIHKVPATSTNSTSSSTSTTDTSNHPIFIRARSDVQHMLHILQHRASLDEPDEPIKSWVALLSQQV